MPNHTNGTGPILLAIVLLSFIGVGGAVAVTIWGTNREERALVYIGAVVVLGAKILLGIVAERKGKADMVQEVSGVKKEVADAARRVEEESVRLRQEVDELQRGRGEGR